MNSISSFSVHPAIRVGIIGVGDTACTYYTSLQSLKGVGSVTFFSEAPAELPDTDEFNTPISDFNTFLPSVDAVCLCSPLSANLSYASEILDAGVPLLVDISMCASTADLAELALHARPSATAGIGNPERFNPAVQAAAERIRDPRYASIEQSRMAAGEAGVSATSALIAPYLDVLLPHLPMGIDSVCAIGGAWVMYVLLRSGDVPLYFSVNSMASAPMASLYVEDAEATIRCDSLRGAVVFGSRFSYGRDSELVTQVEPVKADAHALMLAEFLRCAAAGKAFGVGFAEAERVFAVCERIEAEASAGKMSAWNKARA